MTALVGAMVGLAIAVGAVLAERRPSAGAAGVSADLIADVGAGVGAGQGGSAEAMSWRPPAWRVGTLAPEFDTKSGIPSELGRFGPMNQQLRLARREFV